MVGTLAERTRRRLERYESEPPLSPAALNSRLQAGLQRFLSESHELEFADRPLAIKVYQHFQRLTQQDISTDRWPIVQAAALYLLDPDDDDNDLTSPLGMEDDAEVFNDLCDWLGHPGLKVPY